MNQIPIVQNLPEQLRLRRAARATYDLAQSVVMWQAALTVVVPIVGAVAALFFPALKPGVAGLALAITLIDSIGLDRWQKQILRRGARISETFDCRVLELPWDAFAVGPAIEPEVVREAEARFERRGVKAVLTDWYPVDVGGAPIHLARLMCQRANLYYDSSLRRSYARYLRTLAIGAPVLLLIAAGVAAVAGARIVYVDVLLMAATVTPLISWGLREAYRQSDTADALENLMTQARLVWAEALEDRCGEDQCALKAREFQGAIFNRRATATPILPGVYARRRARLEDEMNAGASDFLAQYQAKLAKAA